VTVNTVAAVGFLNVGTQLALAQQYGPADAALAVAALFAVFVVQGMRRAKRLDKFEKDLRK
jgi:hypothetical protein